MFSFMSGIARMGGAERLIEHALKLFLYIYFILFHLLFIVEGDIPSNVLIKFERI